MVYSQARAFAEGAQGFVTWRQYGALGDGTTDDSAAINAAHAAADASGAFVKMGTSTAGFRITAPINIYDGLTIVGEGPEQTKIIADRCDGFLCQDSLPGDTGATADFNLSGFKLIGNDDTATDGADYVGMPLVRPTRFTVKDVTIQGFTSNIQIDGRANTSGDTFGAADGIISNCQFVTNNVNQQVNATNNYPGILCEVLSESDGRGGADGILFTGNRFYAEILADSALGAGDGATVSYTPFGGIKASKTVTADNFVKVEYVSAIEGARTVLSAGVDYSIDRATDPNDPTLDFSAGTSPLGAPVALTLLSTSGDGGTKAFTLAGRPSFPATAGGRTVAVTVQDAGAQVGGTDYAIVDSNNKQFDFETAAVDTAADTIALVGSVIDSINYTTGIGSVGTGRVVQFTTTGTLPAGLSLATDYYMVVDDPNNKIQLATTYANAVAGTPVVVDITDAGSGTHTLDVQHSIEFATAPVSGKAVTVLDANLVFRWLNPNADVCVKLCQGAQRVSFISNVFGGGVIGLDWDNARRCIGLDNYFQICDYAMSFGVDAQEIIAPGFSARTDATLISGLVQDLATRKTNAWDELLPQGTTVRDFFYLKEELDEADGDASRIRKSNGQLQLDALNAGGSVRVGVNGVSRYVVNGLTNRHQFLDQSGVEIGRFTENGAWLVGQTNAAAGILLGVTGDVDVTGGLDVSGTLTAGSITGPITATSIENTTIGAVTPAAATFTDLTASGTVNLPGGAFADTVLSAIDTSKAVTAVDVFVYDTSKDSDGGAWRNRTQATSWYNETLNTATRGARKEFPVVAVIVVEATKVTIYDGDDSTMPMWRVEDYTGLTLTSINAIHGSMAVAASTGLILSSYVGDDIGSATLDYTTATTPAIVNNAVNDVAMAVLPNAPIDPATGIQVPTIVVATDGGVSVIKDDGTVWTPTGVGYVNAKLSIAPTGISGEFYGVASRSTEPRNSATSSDTFYLETKALGNGFTEFFKFNVFNETWTKIETEWDSGIGISVPSYQPRGTAGLVALSPSPVFGNSMVAYTTPSYNTGWMNGDIKGAFLSDTDDADVTGGTELDRSVNGNDLTVNGTITKTAVATGADLVEYSGFSGSNYLEQAYNADLHFGTGDFSVMGWFKTTNTTGAIFMRETTFNAGTGYGLYLTAGQIAILAGSTAALTDGVNYSDGLRRHFALVRRSGVAYLYINGVQTYSVARAGTTTDATATVRIGLRHDDSDPMANASLALIRVSATAPTAEQIAKIYNDEKMLFQENAACTLYGASDSVTALAHDPETGLLHVGTSAGRSVFQGLRRVSNTTTAVGTAISASDNLVVEE